MTAAELLVVEDDLLVAQDLELTLGELGYRVTDTVDSGEAAMAAVTAHKPDLVLMDIQLRGQLNGVDAARAIRQQMGLPVVYLTAYADEQTLDEARTTQPYGYLLKPFQARELKTTIEVALYKHRMDRMLRDSEERFRNLFEEDLAAHFVADEEGCIVAQNRAFRELLAAGDEDELGELVVERLFDDPEVAQRIRSELGEKGRLKLWEIDVRRRDGSVAHTLANLVLVPRYGRGGPEVHGHLLDVTERKKLQERVVELHRVEALGRMACGVAHDFNNLLMVVQGSVDLLGGRIDDRRSQEEISRIRRVVGQAAIFTAQLLAYGRRKESEARRIDLSREIVRMEELLRSCLGAPARLVLDLTPELPEVWIDPQRVEQILLNLVGNARDAMPRGGTLEVRTRYEPPSHSSRAPFVLLRVSDTGEGMDAETRRRIFEPYFTTKPLSGGTGLGLAMVHGFVGDAGGTIRVESEPGQGATFELRFPPAGEERQGRERNDAKEMEAADASAPVAVEGSETILLVDDSKEIRGFLRSVLEDHGYSVLEAPAGPEALEAAAEVPGRVDLLLTDVTMPGMTGWELADRLLQVEPGLRVVFMSGYSEERFDHVLTGGDRPTFIQKPLRHHQLLLTIRRLLDQAE